MFNPEQIQTLKVALEIFKSMTQDCITDYGDIPAHAQEVVEMKGQLQHTNEIAQILGIELGGSSLINNQDPS